MLLSAAFLLLLQDDRLEAERIRALVAQLGSEEPARREAATRELTLLGHRAAKAVEAALQGARDPEARKALEPLVEFLAGTRRITEQDLQARKVDYTIEAGSFSEAARDLMKRFHLPIEILVPDADASQLERRSFAGAPLEEILGHLAASTQARWQVVGERKIVFLKDPTARKPGFSLKIYDVSALTFRILDMPGRAPSDGEDGVAFVDQPAEATPLVGGEDLVQLVQESVAKDVWNQEDYSIAFQHGMLIVKTTDAVHAQVEQYLEQVRKDYLMQVRLEFFAVAHTPGYRAELLRVPPRLLTDAQLEEILKDAAAEDQAAMVSRLELTCFQGQRICGQSGSERAFVHDYVDGKPQRGILFDGLWVDVKPTVSHDRKTATLTLHGLLAKTLSVEKFKTPDGEIQAPKRSKAPMSLTPTLECGRPAVLFQSGPLEGFGKGRTQVLVLVRVTPLPAK